MALVWKRGRSNTEMYCIVYGGASRGLIPRNHWHGVREDGLIDQMGCVMDKPATWTPPPVVAK
jgi:hypothetical protein